MPPSLCPPPVFSAGDACRGFRLQQVVSIPEIRVTAYEGIHEASGARVLHLHCDDRENVFAIGFRTPPPDATGLPHILEHAVLAGSERYPLKDVFNELLRGTLQTFLNAFTYPDKTVYPVASQVKADFFHLARVYLDLVLHPRLLPETFRQEGHHLEFTDPDNPASDLMVSGIVFHEMKGAYSSPEALLAKAIQEHLFPDTVYALDAGGEPTAIPSLTYARFRDFHRQYYSPANARIFLYGNIPTEEHLAFLAEALAGFGRAAAEAAIPLQPRWSAPRTIRLPYPIGRNDRPARKTFVQVAWLLAENTDAVEALLLQIAAGALLGHAACPLRKALVDSGLGEDLSPASGLEKDLRQMVFSAGLRGTNPGEAGAIEELILQTLRVVADRGFEKALIEGVLHQVEFHGREIVRGNSPYGLVLMDRAFHTWLYDGDPLTGLNFPRLIADVRRRWQETPDLFGQTVRRWLLDNPHRLTVALEPSPTLAEERERAFREDMDRRRNGMTAEAREAVRLEAASLKAFQSAPDLPEAAAALPALTRADLPRRGEETPTEPSTLADVPVLRHELFANGIAYADLAFDIAHIPEDLQPLLPTLAKLTVNLGAAGLGYADMAQRISLYAGGLGCHLAAGMTADGRGAWQKLVFHLRALHRNLPEACAILRDLLLAGDLTEDERIGNLLAEKKNALQAAVVPSGHVFARRIAASGLSLPARRDEQWHGRTQLGMATRLAGSGQNRKERESLRERLTALRRSVFQANKLTVNLTGDAEGLAFLTPPLAELCSRLSRGGAPEAGVSPVPPVPARGVAVPAEVAYVARVLPAPPYADPLAAPLTVLARHLAGTFLYRQIRVHGGAYGAMCHYDPAQGLFAFLSYRDPRIVETLETFGQAASLVLSRPLAPPELEKAVIGAVGGLDRPLDPYGKGYAALLRHFAGLTEDLRQAFRERLLGMEPAEVQEGAAWLAETFPTGATAVLAAEEALREANARLGEMLCLEPLVAP